MRDLLKLLTYNILLIVINKPIFTLSYNFVISVLLYTNCYIVTSVLTFFRCYIFYLFYLFSTHLTLNGTGVTGVRELMRGVATLPKVSRNL